MKKKGSILIIVLIIVSSILLLSASLLDITNSNYKIACLYSNSLINSYVSEAGIERSLSVIKINITEIINSKINELNCSELYLNKTQEEKDIYIRQVLRSCITNYLFNLFSHDINSYQNINGIDSIVLNGDKLYYITKINSIGTGYSDKILISITSTGYYKDTSKSINCIINIIDKNSQYNQSYYKSALSSYYYLIVDTWGK